MQNTPLLFDLKDLGTEANSMKRVIDSFSQLGETLEQHDIGKTLKRTAGITYKEVILTFADSQTVTFFIKQTGDIWKVKVNNKETPLRNQDAHRPEEIIQEIAQRIKSGRTAYQKKLAATANAGDVVKSATNAGLKNTQKMRITELENQAKALDEAIAEAQKTKAELEAENG